MEITSTEISVSFGPGKKYIFKFFIPSQHWEVFEIIYDSDREYKTSYTQAILHLVKHFDDNICSLSDKEYNWLCGTLENFLHAANKADRVANNEPA